MNEFYAEAGRALPSVVRIAGSDMPEPYRTLLVHERDMTPTLEDACGRSIELRVLSYSRRGDVLSRQIDLVPEGGGNAVLFGAIKIYLQRLPPEARRLALELKQPLGAILRSQRIAHSSRPDAYIRVRPDPVITSALDLSGNDDLYGRRNVLLDNSQNILARVLEILPPAGMR